MEDTQVDLESRRESDLVFDRVEREASPRLQGSQTDVVNGSHRYHKPIPSNRRKETVN